MDVAEAGSGTPLVLLHAFPLDSRMWDPLRAELSPAVEVIAPDLRGFGRTPLPAEHGEPSMHAVADDVIALMDERGLRRAVVGGCSMGGYVAMSVLRKAPHRVSGLLLIDTRPDADEAERRANRLAAADRAETDGTGWLADTVLPGLLAAGTPDVSSELVATVRSMITAQPSAGVAWAQRAMAARPDASDVLRSFDGPALVVVGERDVLSPPEQAREMAALLPGGELVELPGCGHLSPLEAPAELATAITRWLVRANPR